jgi:hypothetical protein
MNANWEAIGAVGEILGAAAVVATLVYLAVQVRFAKAAAADSNRINRANGVREMALAMANNRDLVASVAKSTGSDGYYREFGERFGLSVEEAGEADSWNAYWFWLHWGQYRSANDPSDVEEIANIIKTFCPTPSVWLSWNNSPHAKAIFEPEFVRFVERTVREVAVPPSEGEVTS